MAIDNFRKYGWGIPSKTTGQTLSQELSNIIHIFIRKPSLTETGDGI